MRTGVIYSLVGVLLAGCASRPTKAVHNADLNFTNDAQSAEGVVLKELGARLVIRTAADSWTALVEKTKPTFAWNGCDLMWIETDAQGQPRFVLDEAFGYQPTNQPRQVVLLDYRVAPWDEAYGQVMGYNECGVATMHDTIPLPHNDAGDVEDYAVAISSHPKFGTVYEIGWQCLMSNGTAHYNRGRRIYVWREKSGTWQFLGEGPEEGAGRGGWVSMKARVIWRNSGSDTIPLSIQFISKSTENEPYEGSMAEFAKPNLTICDDWELAGSFPAQMRQASDRGYLLAEKGDTVEKILKRVGTWMPEMQDEDPKTQMMVFKPQALAKLREKLLRLNPELRRKNAVREGTRVEMLTYKEERLFWEPVEKLKGN